MQEIERILTNKAFFVASLLLIFSLVARSQSDIKFKRFDPDQGLSMNDIRAIAQDKKGFIWVGTLDGLNRFDGYNFTVYKYNSKIKNSLSNNTIWALYADRKGDIYIGTDDGGLNVYNEEQDNFISYKHDPKDPTSIGGNEVSSIFEDNKGTLWIGTDGGGLNSFDRVTKKFTCYKHNPQNSNSIISNVIKTITEDKQGSLWIGTDNGISVWDKNRKTFTQYQHNDKDPKSLGFNNIIKIYVDSENKKWVGTYFGLYAFNDSDHSFTTYLFGTNSILGNYVPDIYENKPGQLWIATNFGISVLDKKTNTFTAIQTKPNDPLSLIDNGMNTFFWDSRGNIWIGTFVGLCMKEAGDAKFKHFTFDPTNVNSLGIKGAACFLEDSNGNIWVGLRSGFDKFDKINSVFAHYNPIKNGDLLRDVQVLYEDKNYNFWIGTGNGICLYDREKGTFERFTESNPGGIDNVPLQEIWYIQENSKDSLWVCSFNRGAFMFNKKEKRFYPLKWDNKYIPNKDIFTFHIDKEDNIWIGTALEGLYKINKEKGVYEVFKKGDKNGIGSNFILSIHEDARNNFWVGTRGGLNLMDRKTNKFVNYTENDGLPNNVINSILEDDKGNLWLGTYKGISKFDPVNSTFKNYTVDDGLQHSNFWERSAYKLKSGELLLGGLNGFNLFHPDNLKDNKDQPKVYITDFQIFNKSVPIRQNDSPLQKHISETKEIVLSYKQSVISFDFVALNYIISKNNKYAYKLDGFDKDWNYVGSARRKATYTNLDAGNYVFRVKGSNNDGIWNETGTSINITITPPFWKTWWFKIFSFVFVIGSAIYWYRRRINIIKKQKEILEQQVKERTAEILIQKEEIEAQADHLQEANTEIKAQGQKLEELFSEVKDSIRAAQVIQESILPASSFIEKHLPESFVLYKPKDVVSGDFYWFDVVKEKIVIAAVDCTGHGVSGAFMSINGHHLLNQAIYPYENLVANEVLDRLNTGVINALHHQDKNADIKDGMDVALCIIDKEKMKLQFAGAINPLYVLRGEEIIQIKANKFPIGLVIEGQAFKFTNNEMDLQKGDTLYIFSDGYADQMGGEDGYQKLMYNRFRQMLIDYRNVDMKQQLKLLDENLTAWQKGLDQLDDILVIGFKV